MPENDHLISLHYFKTSPPDKFKRNIRLHKFRKQKFLGGFS